MLERKKIIIYTSFFLGSLLMGTIAAAITSLYILYASKIPINYHNLQSIFQENSIYYLVKIIPFFTAMIGALIAHLYLREQDRLISNETSLERSLNSMVDFIEKIKRGELGDSVSDMNIHSRLKKSMEDMRQYLLSLNKKEKDRMNISGTIAEINKLLRPINESQKLTDEVIRFVVNKIDIAIQGAFYIVDKESGENGLIKLVSIYAYDRKKHIQKIQHFQDGLIGQCVLEKDIIHLTEIPADYVSITSGLIGHQKPKSILITPLIVKDEVTGVIELAAAVKFSKLQIQLIKEIAEITARSIQNVAVNEKTRHLLEESKKMSAELAEQKKQLEQNAREMIATQEKLEKTNETLEDRVQEVYHTNQKTQIILENSLEVIYIYDSEGITTYVSPSILPVLGYHTEDVAGKKFSENIHPLDTKKYEKFLTEIRSFPEKKHKLQYRYFTKKGEILWMEARGKVSLSKLINGIVINARDISEQKLAEKEQRIRAKMQALSENSPDIIIRIDIFSRCTYINPAIESLTGLGIEQYMNKPMANVGLDETVVTFFKTLLEDVSTSREKKKAEMTFPSEEENKILDVSAIPEYYENGDVESVLFVCHDITIARKREELIQQTNKSITDSINYAYYIQSSLMPTEEDIRAIIPKSFMMYLPKDIVSGDYPFLYRDKDLVYIGAMDCTGHGVPGALMSIIGYFLQNQIIYPDCPDDAGQILTKLHKNVVSTLRQEDEGSMINDGMDAAFLKIDLKSMTLNYAGAHRPLYVVSEGNFNEIGGDKYPVGSTQYTKRNDFINHEIKLKPGDTFYLTTDGYADQYGGPNGKMKFMRGRLNKMIKENTHLSIFQMGKLFSDTHEDWKGEYEQLDDILVIGLKF